MKNRSFRSIFVSVIIGIILVISIANFVVYGLNYIEIRDSKIQKMEDVDAYMNDMITISLNNLKGLKQICYTDNNARNILLEDNGINDQKTKFENQSYMDNALKHIASMDTVILRATIINRYGNIYCTDTSVPEKYASSIQEMTGEWNLLRGKEDEYYFGGIQGNEENIPGDCPERLHYLLLWRQTERNPVECCVPDVLYHCRMYAENRMPECRWFRENQILFAGTDWKREPSRFLSLGVKEYGDGCFWRVPEPVPDYGETVRQMVQTNGTASPRDDG